MPYSLIDRLLEDLLLLLYFLLLLLCLLEFPCGWNCWGLLPPLVGRWHVVPLVGLFLEPALFLFLESPLFLFLERCCGHGQATPADDSSARAVLSFTVVLSYFLFTLALSLRPGLGRFPRPGTFPPPGMFAMFKKVAAKERICGFYTTGPKIRENDLAIAELFK